MNLQRQLAFHAGSKFPIGQAVAMVYLLGMPKKKATKKKRGRKPDPNKKIQFSTRLSPDIHEYLQHLGQGNMTQEIELLNSKELEI